MVLLAQSLARRLALHVRVRLLRWEQSWAALSEELLVVSLDTTLERQSVVLSTSKWLIGLRVLRGDSGYEGVSAECDVRVDSRSYVRCHVVC